MRLEHTFIAVVTIVYAAVAQQLPRLQHIEFNAGVPSSFGTRVATVGDLDHDGFEDYAVGSPDETLGNPSVPQYLGVVRVYSGATGAILHTLSGTLPFDRFGWSVGGGGDVDADGTPDVIVGLPLGANTSTTGNVKVFSGSSGLSIRTYVLPTLYGYRVANAGDIDGDGRADVMTSSGLFALPSASTLTPVLVLSGATGLVIASYTGIAAGVSTPYDSWGISLAGGRDLNGDGRDDVLIGFASQGGLGNQHGGVVACSGLTGGVIQSYGGAPVFSFLGESVVFMPDIDGDGRPDVVAGGTGNGSVSVPGTVRAYSGLGGALLFSITSPVLADSFGGALAGGRDLDGDGVADFVTSTPGLNPSGIQPPAGSALGVVRAYSGATGALIGLVAGRAPGANYGGALAMLADTNGDGFDEVVVGAGQDDTIFGTDAGSVDVIEFAGALGFGVGNGTLQLGVIHGPFGANWVGALRASGAGPGAAGFIAADLAPANTTIANPPIPLYLAVTPALLLQPITFDGSGAWSTPVLLRQPAVAGLVAYAQAFEVSGPTFVASGGMQLLFSN